MPSPYDKPHHQSQPRAALRALLEKSEPDLAAEVAALRHEIAALRHELKPVSSLILTGERVAAEFRRMTAERQ
jgi:hypothetical protein